MLKLSMDNLRIPLKPWVKKLSYLRKGNFYDGEKMQDHERKSHKLTAKLNCEYFFIAAESQDYPRPTIDRCRALSFSLPYLTWKIKKAVFISNRKRLQFPQIVKFANDFALIKVPVDLICVLRLGCVFMIDIACRRLYKEADAGTRKIRPEVLTKIGGINLKLRNFNLHLNF